MDALDKIKNFFTGTQTNNSSQAGISGNDFLRNGNRQIMNDNSTIVKLNDSEYYKGYPYAALTNRANKVAQLGTSSLKTDATEALLEEFSKKEEDLIHPYLKLIDDSDSFTNTQFWYDISTYIDLEGVYYLMAVRNVSPNLIGDIQYFSMLNPYNIQRVVNKDTMEVGGYIENRNGFVRNIPKEMIIEIRKLNPFNPDQPYAMTDAAKEYQFAIQQANDYTRSSLQNNLSAPGIIATDVILEPENFANFQSRIMSQKKGAPIFANGAKAVSWEPMNIDMDKAALSEINSINRDALFAVSGVSKTTMGIEESGTTRETSKTQKDKFVEDHIMPQVQLIIDALNQDYKKYYKKEYEKNQFKIYIDNPLSTDKDAEIKDIEIRESMFSMVANLSQVGYEFNIAAQYAKGEIDIEGLGEPTLEPELTQEQILEIAQAELNREESESVAPVDSKGGKTTENFLVHNALNGAVSSSRSKMQKKGINRENIDLAKLSLASTKKAEEVKAHEDKDEPVVQAFVNKSINALQDDQKTIIAQQQASLQNSIQNLEAEMVVSMIGTIERVNNAFDKDSDVMSEEEEKRFINALTLIIAAYYMNVFPIYGNQLLNKRTNEFGFQTFFDLDDSMENYIQVTARRAANSHVNTIVDDILKVARNVYEESLDELTESLQASRNYSDEEIFKLAREKALEGASRQRIISAITTKYEDISKTRATAIARTETNRAFSQSQYQADIQFLRSTNLMNSAYKVWETTNPDPCTYCLDLASRGPIPFTQNFQDLGTELSYEYTKNNGEIVTRTLKIDYEALNAGNAHVNCGCRYRLVIKNDSGEFVENMLYEIIENGGSGSGNFGHGGRPGKVGGSGKGGRSIDKKKVYETIFEYYDKPTLERKDMFEKIRSIAGIENDSPKLVKSYSENSEVVYRGTNSDDDGLSITSWKDWGGNFGESDSGLYLTRDKNQATSYGKNVHEFAVKKSAKLLDSSSVKRQEIIDDAISNYQGKDQFGQRSMIKDVLGRDAGIVSILGGYDGFTRGTGQYSEIVLVDRSLLEKKTAENNFESILNKGNPYRDLKTGEFDETPFGKKMTKKGGNREKIDEAKVESLMKGYSATGNLEINNLLREAKGDESKLDNDFIDDVKIIDSIMIDKISDNNLYRGTYADMGDFKEGDTFKDFGFGSYSKSETMAGFYADPDGDQGPDDMLSREKRFKNQDPQPYVFKLKTPKNFKAVDMEKHGWEANDSEKEVLVPRNLKYKVTKVTKGVDFKDAVDQPYSIQVVEVEIENYSNNSKNSIDNSTKGNPYRDLKTGEFDDAPFSKKMTDKDSNRKKIDEKKLELKTVDDANSNINSNIIDRFRSFNLNVQTQESLNSSTLEKDYKKALDTTRKELGPQTRGSWNSFENAQYIKRKSLENKPKQVNREDFEKLKNSGDYVHVYRNAGKQEYIEAFKNGSNNSNSYHMYGEGVYFAKDKKFATGGEFAVGYESKALFEALIPKNKIIKKSSYERKDLSPDVSYLIKEGKGTKRYNAMAAADQNLSSLLTGNAGVHIEANDRYSEDQFSTEQFVITNPAFVIVEGDK